MIGRHLPDRRSTVFSSNHQDTACALRSSCRVVLLEDEHIEAGVNSSTVGYDNLRTEGILYMLLRGLVLSSHVASEVTLRLTA
jgi:hypothetical protein